MNTTGRHQNTNNPLKHNFTNAKSGEVFCCFCEVRALAVKTWKVYLASVVRAGCVQTRLLAEAVLFCLHRALQEGRKQGKRKSWKGKYWLKERRHKEECGRTVNEPERMEKKKSSATVIRLDFRSNCSVPASANAVGNICPHLCLQRRKQVVSARGAWSWCGCTNWAQMWTQRGIQCLPSPCCWKWEQRPTGRFAGNGSDGHGGTNAIACVGANTGTEREKMVQIHVSNLILNRRCLNYHQCLPDAAAFAESMERLGWYLPPSPQVGAGTGMWELQSTPLPLRCTSPV